MIRILLFALVIAVGLTIYTLHSRMRDHNLIGATTDINGWQTIRVFSMPPLASEDGALRIKTNPIGPQATPVVLFRTDAVIAEGQRYVISFDAKAEPARQMELVAENNNGLTFAAPRILGLKMNVPLATEWKHYDYTFTGKDADGQIDRFPRLQFEATDSGGSVWLKNMRLDRIE